MSEFQQYLQDLKNYRDSLRKARKERFIQQLPYRVWFWLLILFSLYLVSPF